MKRLRKHVSVKNVVDFYKAHPECVGRLNVRTPYGFKTIEAAEQTDMSVPLEISTLQNKLVCSKNHRIKISSGEFIHSKDLKIGAQIMTSTGPQDVVSIKSQDRPIALYDFQVSDVQQYFTNGIVSHNSTLMVDAILFALFNKTSKKLKKPHIINRQRKKDCVVKIFFHIEDDSYEINNCVYPTYVRLFKNGEDITKSSIKETFEYIEREVIKSSFVMMRNSLILSITGNRNIFEMAKWEKRNFVEQVMDLHVIGKMYLMINEDINTLEKETKVKRQRVNDLRKNIAEFREKSTNFDAEKKTKVIALQKEIKGVQEKIAVIDVSKEGSLTEKLEAIDEARRKVLTIKEKAEDKRQLIRDESSSLKTKMEHGKKIKGKYAKVLDTICDKCVDKVSKVVGLSEFDLTAVEDRARIGALTLSEKELLEKLVVLRKKVEALDDARDKVDQALRRIGSSKQDLEYLQKDVERKQAQVEEESKKMSPFEDLIEKYEGELCDLLKDMKADLKRKKYLEVLHYTTSEEGVKQYMTLNFVNSLNKRIRKYLEEMGCEYTAVFDGNFDCEFITVSGPCDYFSFSAGEKVRIDSAYMFALRDLLFSQGTLRSNIFICDEILDVSLDNYAINSVIKILKEISLTQTVFLISHRECVSPEDFNGTIYIKKEKGFTTIGDVEEFESCAV